jgi:hypothetical protein
VEELASLQDRLWLAVNSTGWVDRRIFRQWCEWFAVWLRGIRVLWDLQPEEAAILVVDNTRTRADLVALQLLASNHIHLVTFPPHLTHILQPVDVCWARVFNTRYGRYIGKWLEGNALAQAYAHPPPAARRGRRTKARDSRVCIAFASAEAARVATTFNASHAFSVAGLVPFRVEKALAHQYVRDCATDVERGEEAKKPQLLRTSSKVLTSPEVLERLSEFVAHQGEVRQRIRTEVWERLQEQILTGEFPPVPPAEPPPAFVEDDLEVDPLQPRPKAFEKLAAVTERIAPTVPEDGEAV